MIAVSDLQNSALRARENIVRLSTNGGCFLGASLSAVDLITYLYKHFLRIPSLASPERDYFFLSKGHDVPALYSVLVELGWIEKERLSNHLKPNDHVYWHPNRNVPGVEFHSGSLGHLLSVAIGVAMDCRMKKTGNRVVVVVGDGELDEGSNWEALLVAKAYKLSNLLIIVDRNHFQANVRTEELIPLEPLDEKFRAFGSHVKSIDGHDFEAMDDAFQSFPYSSEGPSVVIAHTVRGKGLPSIQERADRWFCNFNAEEIESLLLELRGEGISRLTSETLVVR